MGRKIVLLSAEGKLVAHERPPEIQYTRSWRDRFETAATAWGALRPTLSELPGPGAVRAYAFDAAGPYVDRGDLDAWAVRSKQRDGQ